MPKLFIPLLSLAKQENIEVITGDRFMAENNIEHVDFIKMDLEGSEMDALVGLEKSLSEKRVRLIQFEYGYINITTKNLLADYYDFFAKHGYLVGKVYPKRVEFRKYEFKHEDFIGPNFVAAHQADAPLIKLLSN